MLTLCEHQTRYLAATAIPQGDWIERGAELIRADRDAAVCSIESQGEVAKLSLPGALAAIE